MKLTVCIHFFRWGHTFPRGPQGELLIQHYQYPVQDFQGGRSRDSSECFEDDVYHSSNNNQNHHSSVFAIKCGEASSPINRRYI